MKTSWHPRTHPPEAAVSSAPRLSEQPAASGLRATSRVPAAAPQPQSKNKESETSFHSPRLTMPIYESGVVKELHRKASVRRSASGPQSGCKQHRFSYLCFAGAHFFGCLRVNFDAIHALRSVRDSNSDEFTVFALFFGVYP